METVEIKSATDLLGHLNTTKANLEAGMETKAKEIVEAQIKEVNQKIEAVKGLPADIDADTLKQMKTDIDATVKGFDQFQVKMNALLNGITPTSKATEEKSFNTILAETIDRNKDAIQSYRKEQGLVSFDMLPELKEAKKSNKEIEVKAVGDMSIAANFNGSTQFTTDFRNANLIENPYNRLWLSDILPQGNTTGSSILYPKENGGEGGAAVWTDKATDKPQMDFDLTSQSAYLKWIAGIVIVEREMLDDIDFMTAYIQNKMLISLKTAENGFIMDGTTDSNPVQGINDIATAYNGTQVSAVDRVLDAAYGQLVEDTFEFYQPTTIVVTPRASVTELGLNKAVGSGEYNLPAGSVGFAAGQLAIAGLQVVKTLAVGAGNFLAFDRNAAMFIRRMRPELRIFEDAALAKRNKIMFRIEERVTLATFNNKAFVKGSLVAAP